MVMQSGSEESIDKNHGVQVEINSLEAGKGGENPDIKGKDFALEYAELSKGLVLTDEDNKRIRRRIDMFVMPLIAISYGVQFLDRAASSYGSIMGLRTDLNMVGDMYSWTATSFYLGYLVWAFPGSWTLQRFPLAKGVSAYVFLWGLTLALQSACFKYSTFIVGRVFLGVFESPLLAGLALITNNFYHKSEQYTRTCFYFSFCGLGNIIGASLAYGIQKHSDSFAIPPWRALFIILGCATMLLGVTMAIVIPDIPAKAWWLKGDDKLLTVERIRDNEQGFGSDEFKWYQVKEAFLEPRAWIYALLAMAVEIPNSGITAYASIILKDEFKFETAKALLMKSPLGVTQLVGLSLLGLCNRYRIIKHPLIISAIGICLALTGGAMLGFAPTKYSRLAGFYLIGFSPITMITALSGLSTNIAGRTKKVVCNGMYLVGFCFACAVGPQTFLPSEAPNYRTAKNCLVGFYCFGLFLIGSLATYNWNSNRLRDKEREELGDKYVKVENSEFRDLTDRENRDFRYVW